MLTNMITFFLLLLFPLFHRKKIIFVKSIQLMLISFLLGNPKQVFTKLVKNLKHCSSFFIIFCLTCHFDGSIDCLHDDLHVVPFRPKI